MTTAVERAAVSGDHGAIEVRVPTLARPDDDALLVTWHRKAGHRVTAGEPLADLETDKVVLEVPAPVGGILAEILVPEGAEVGPGTLLALIEPAPASEAVVPDPPAAAAVVAVPIASGRGQRREPMTRIRRRIADNLLLAHTSQALVTTVNDVDMTAVREMRARYNARLRTAPGTGMGYLPFFVKAAVVALRQFPVVNAVIDGPDVVHRDFYDIGIAVSTERGLLVPVVRDVDRKSYTELERETEAVAVRARSGRITVAELAGGTFTVTNGGVFGSLLSTPIVSPQQSAILGVHAIQDRAVVVDGAIVVRPMMYLALTYDHRLVDGSTAIQFLGVVKQCLEEPRRLLAGA
jgi:2-oxoglutarate dehydrogenase E2 component (dihydrolipoamide succinyltransferase)